MSVNYTVRTQSFLATECVNNFWSVAQKCRVISADSVHVVVEFEVCESESNPGGMLNGACTATMFEVVICAALANQNCEYKTNWNWKIKYVAPALVGDTVIVTAAIKNGRSNENGECKLLRKRDQQVVAFCEQLPMTSGGREIEIMPRRNHVASFNSLTFNEHYFTALVDSFLNTYCRGKNFWRFVGKSRIQQAGDGHVMLEFDIANGDDMPGGQLSRGLITTFVDCFTVVALYTTKHRGYGISKEMSIKELQPAFLGETIIVEANVRELSDAETIVDCLLKKKSNAALLAVCKHVMQVSKKFKL